MDEVFNTDAITDFVNSYNLPSQEPEQDFDELVEEYIEDIKEKEIEKENNDEQVKSNSMVDEFGVEIGNRDVDYLPNTYETLPEQYQSEIQASTVSTVIENDVIPSDVTNNVTVSAFDYVIFFGLILLLVLFIVSKLRRT